MAQKRRTQTRRDAMQGLSQAAYARGRGVSREAIRKAVETGKIRLGKGLLKGGRIDPKRANRALAESTDQAKQRGRHAERDSPAPRGRRGHDGPTLNEVKTRREAALAELAEIELAQARGEMVSRQHVKDAADECARLLKERVLSVPGSIIDRLEGLGCRDTITAQRILTEELSRALDSVASAFSSVPAPAAPAPEPAAAAPPAA